MLERLNELFVRLTTQDEEGQGMVEYGLIIALVAVVVIVTLGILGGKVADMFNQVSQNL